MSDFVQNPIAVFWCAIAVITCAPLLASYWRQMKRDELETSLKRDMIARGMSADEIERILQAKMHGTKKDGT